MKKEERDKLRLFLLETNTKSSRKEAKSLIMNEEGFCEASLIALSRLPPQSYGPNLESWVKEFLGLENKIDNLSGDSSKGEETHEIKVSIENGSAGQFNFVQIRPHHKITHYIFVTYSVTKDEEFWLKVPSQELYELLPEFGGYAHGTVAAQGPITPASIVANKFEYALRPSMFTGPKSKTGRLWNILLNYRTSVEELKKCL